jgi:hypothetical protein
MRQSGTKKSCWLVRAKRDFTLFELFCLMAVVMLHPAMTRPAQGNPILTSDQPESGSKFLTGKALAEYWRAYIECARESKDCANAALYTPYILGAYDGFAGHKPMRIAAGQLESIVGKYLDAHPDKWHENAALFVGSALQLSSKSNFLGGSFKSGSDLSALLRKTQECADDPKGKGCTKDLAAEAIQNPKGIHDALLAQGLLPNCEEQDCSAGGIEKIVRRYLAEHPEKATLNSRQIVMEAIQNAFPLNKQ